MESVMKTPGIARNKIITIVLPFVVILFLSFVGASSNNIGTFKAGCISLYQYCDNCTFVNLTTITLPNSSLLHYNLQMTQKDSTYNATICNLTEHGDYSYIVCGDKDGSLRCERLTFSISPSGRPFLSGRIYLIAGILLPLSFLFFFLIFYSIDKFAKIEMGLKELIYNISFYFVILSTYYINKFYLDDKLLNSLLVILIIGGAFANVIFPIIAYIVNEIKRKLERQEHEFEQPL